eukprot:2341204-Rhodomonas_salina.1
MARHRDFQVSSLQQQAHRNSFCLRTSSRNSNLRISPSKTSIGRRRDRGGKLEGRQSFTGGNLDERCCCPNKFNQQVGYIGKVKWRSQKQK